MQFVFCWRQLDWSHPGSLLSTSTSRWTTIPQFPAWLPTKTGGACPPPSIMVDIWMSCFSNITWNHWTLNLRDLTWKWQERVAGSPHVTLRRGVYCQPSVPLWMLSGLKRKPLIKCVIQGTFQNRKVDLQVNYKHSLNTQVLPRQHRGLHFVCQGQWKKKKKKNWKTRFVR